MKSNLIVSAHQPNFMPYLGFFDKMKRSNILVIRDEVLFVKKEFHNRNRIRINGRDNLNAPESKWIGVPVEDPHDFILHAKIAKDSKVKNVLWNEALLKEIKTHYAKTKFFDSHFSEFEKIFGNSHERLIDLNMEIIKFFAKKFDIKTKIVLASELGLKGKNYAKSDASQDLVNICKVCNAGIYLSGDGGKTYLNQEPFEKEGIKVDFQNYKHPVYPQNYVGFHPYMAAIDALFCVGKFPVHKEEVKIPQICA